MQWSLCYRVGMASSYRYALYSVSFPADLIFVFRVLDAAYARPAGSRVHGSSAFTSYPCPRRGTICSIDLLLCLLITCLSQLKLQFSTKSSSPNAYYSFAVVNGRLFARTLSDIVEVV